MLADLLHFPKAILISHVRCSKPLKRCFALHSQVWEQWFRRLSLSEIQGAYLGLSALLVWELRFLLILGGSFGDIEQMLIAGG